MDESAEFFDAFSHPTRIKILKILEKHPSSFASLKRYLNIESSGNLDHHLKKLAPLIGMQEDGLYALNAAGRKALSSVAAIEEWAASDRLKQKTFVSRPFEVSVLAILTLVVAVVPLLVTAQVLYSDALNVPFLPLVYSFVAVLSVSSLLGLINNRTWAWPLVVVQAVLFLVYVLVPLNFDLYLPNVASIASTENPSPFVWIASILIGSVESGLLGVATRKPVKEFFGKQNAFHLSRSAKLAGALCIFSGILELYTGCAYPFSSVSNVNGGGSGVFTLFFIIAGLPVAIGGIFILLRKLSLGGLLTLVFSLFPIPYFYVGTAFSNTMGLISMSLASLVVAILVVLMPFVAVCLAFLGKLKSVQ